MLKIKIFGSIFAAVLLGLFATQVTSVSAKSNGNNNKPITSPITGLCKPGWGFGDKNHCHSGPPGINKQHNDNKSNLENKGQDRH
ncbi:MAG TPA: hypothetical protein VLG67_04005 [Candidatus Saccharimonadales bacterium]|nr:hypothetical protein [Candidatus Saccharimonadales bacterium]